ncbi:hypothetical protein [Bernardetia sp.]|uniref:hypothetical protein n=1 Tax=Bernardetia sp. TaxID=1937974 RepID=UPI0025BF9CD1|nr:hypothetical protein [Bernardetia sp.]
MAQKRFLEYLSDDLSFSINAFLNGILPQGRYRGFDFVPTDNLFLSLTHDTTGFQYPKADGKLTPFSGVIRTHQGLSIMEDEPMSLQVSANTSSHPRIDLVVCEHQYQAIAGGIDAEYFIIEGTPSENPVEPTLNNPNFQVVIGKLTLPAGTTQLDNPNVEYEQATIPELGNNDLAARFLELLSQYAILQNNFNTLQSNFNTLSQEMIDWRDFYQPVMRFDGINIQWKWAGEDDTAWRDLMQGIGVNLSGPGEMEVRILEAQYLPNAEVYDPASPTDRDHNVLEFNTDTNLPNPATFWVNNRIWVAPQTRSYRVLLDTLKLTCVQAVDFAAINAENAFPFPPSDVLVGDAEGKWFGETNVAIPNNGLLRVEILKNNIPIYEKVSMFKFEDGKPIGHEILINVIDEVFEFDATDNLSFIISTKPNYNIISERIGSVTGYAQQDENTFKRSANTQWVIRNHYQITTGHWTVTPMP